MRTFPVLLFVQYCPGTGDTEPKGHEPSSPRRGLHLWGLRGEMEPWVRCAVGKGTPCKGGLSIPITGEKRLHHILKWYLVLCLSQGNQQLSPQVRVRPTAIQMSHLYLNKQSFNSRTFFNCKCSHWSKAQRCSSPPSPVRRLHSFLYLLFKSSPVPVLTLRHCGTNTAIWEADCPTPQVWSRLLKGHNCSCK
jgi:hypothetical protein